jgi:uncharacterized secreted protein with C-terminal beta-propeller domain
MERKIKKQAVLYGIASVLLALILGTMIYDLQFPLPEFPPALPPPVSASPTSFLTTFSSSEALKSFLASNSRTQGPFQIYGTWDAMILKTLPGAEGFLRSGSYGVPLEHSSTNIQVAGVDETDLVKADDSGYIYVLSGNTLLILRAYQPETAEVVSRMVFDDSYPAGIFVSGDRLVVLGSKYSFPQNILLSRSYYGYYNAEIKTFAYVYDIHERVNPILLRNLTLTGSYFNSRMIDDYIYFVTSKPAYVVNATLSLPEICSNGQVKEITPSEIYYSNDTDDYYQYTTFVAMNMQNTTEAPVYLTIMLGGTSNMYVSPSNMYVTFQKWSGNTTIYRVRIQGKNMTCEAKGEVSGHELSQFSMDEYGDYYRIATTTWVNWTQTNLYVLNMNLSVVGKLENLASGENFHSARFMGNRCYLVTFKQVDPLFVIDLSEPTEPSVLGELKVPGYSDYLHPYDETHLIGVGKETVEAEQGYFAWYQGVKISLFDVRDVTNPIQMANYIIGDRGSDSPVLQDHKAFLFDRSKNLLAIPVLVAKIDASQYPYGVPPYAYGTPIWQGSYIFDISLEHGLVLRGNVTHLESNIDIWNQSYWVKRSLYIDNVLYTVSDKKVKMNNLEDLAPMGEIPLS